MKTMRHLKSVLAAAAAAAAGLAACSQGTSPPRRPAARNQPPTAAASGPHRFVWQVVEVDGDDSTYRARVPGGWLVMEKSKDVIYPPSITFYPDPQHAWDGGTLQ